MRRLLAGNTQRSGRRPSSTGLIEPVELLAYIGASSDDSEELLSDGTTFPTSFDLELGNDNEWGHQAVGLRLPDAPITADTVLDSVTIRFTSDGSHTEPLTLRIWAQAADDAVAFSGDDGDISARTKTSAFVDWVVPSWSSDRQADADTTTPDLSPLVAEVKSRPGWSEGNAIVFIFEVSPEDSGLGVDPVRSAYSYDRAEWVGVLDRAPSFAVNRAHDEPTGGGEPIAGDYSLLGDESFDRLNLDNTETDASGRTLRDWYDKLLLGGTSGQYDWAFDRARNRPANRQGNLFITHLIIGLRMVGDLKLLDEAVRLTELWYSHLTTDSDGYLHHDAGTYDQDLDVRQAAGIWARVMIACHVNRNLTSPAGRDYGEIADRYHNYLVNHYLPRWRGKEGTHLPEGIDHDGGTGRSSWSNTLAVLHYCARMGGGGGFTQAEWDNEVEAAFDQNFAHDSVCNDGHNGRDVLVFPHSAFPVGASSKAQALIYITYVRYVLIGSFELWLEGADRRFSETWLTRLANSFADLVIFDDSADTDELDHTIGGSPSSGERCGVTFEEWGSRTTNAAAFWLESSFSLLEGFDSRNRIADLGRAYNEDVGASADDYPGHPCARIFTKIHHGW